MNISDLTEAFIGLDSYPGFDNFPAQSHNTCGQAVIASVLVHARKASPDLQYEGNEIDAKESLLQQVVTEYGPHWPFQNLISNRKIITSALDAYGVTYVEHVLRPFARGEVAQSQMLHALQRSHPCIVLLDVHRLKLGHPFTLHWAVVFGANSSGVRLSSWGREYRIGWKQFMRSWRIWFLTYPYHNYFIEIL